MVTSWPSLTQDLPIISEWNEAPESVFHPPINPIFIADFIPEPYPVKWNQSELYTSQKRRGSPLSLTEVLPGSGRIGNMIWKRTCNVEYDVILKEVYPKGCNDIG